MSEASDIVCFQCGQSVGDPPKLNRLPDGEPCQSCADRLLDSLPPIFHAPIPAQAEVSSEAEEEWAEEDRDGVEAPGPRGQSSDFEDDQPA